MKRSRSEQVNPAVGQYLRKRQYAVGKPLLLVRPKLKNTDTDVYKRSDIRLQQTVQEMAFQGLISNESSNRNVIGFSSINRDVTTVDQQFSRLKTFINEAVELYKNELTYILFPVFVHLYLELVHNGQKTPALKFRTRHQNLFLEVPEYKSVIDHLANVTSSHDFSKFPSIKSFRENKYTVRLCSETVEYLTRYLKDNDHLILLQILNLHIEVKTQDPRKAKMHLYDEVKSEYSKNSKALPRSVERKVISGDPSLKGLQDAIHKVQEGAGSLPSICLYTFSNTFQGLSSVAIADDLSLLAGGFESSAIRIWSLTSKPLLSIPVERKVSQIRLACDHTSEIDTHAIKPSEMKTLRAHAGPIYGLAFIPSASVLLSCSEDSTVRAWSLNSHTNVAIYSGHNYPVWSVECSPCSTYFATGSQDRTAKLWMLDRTYPLRLFAGHNLDVDCVKFHPNCGYLATGSMDKTVRLWSVQHGKMVRVLQGHRGTIYSLAFSPNGKLLASAGEDRRIKIWDLSAGSVLKELRGHLDTVYSLCFSNDSSALASGGLDNVLRIWDIRKCTESPNPTDSRASPELLAAYPTKSTSLQLLQFSYHNMLVAVGANVSQ